jgi:hypothetical protein
MADWGTRTAISRVKVTGGSTLRRGAGPMVTHPVRLRHDCCGSRSDAKLRRRLSGDLAPNLEDLKRE